MLFRSCYFCLIFTFFNFVSSNQIILGETKTVDVAIVGGGLAGLSAAKKLLDGGKTVLVLEARDRVGGKILNQRLANGGVTEIGAEFVGPTQDKVLEYIDELGLKTFDTYNAGSTILWRNNTRTPYIPDPELGGAPPVPAEALIQIAAAQATLDSWAAELDVNAPWSHPKASSWDTTTLEEFIDASNSLSDTRFMFSSFSRALFGAEPHELSLLYVIAYIASAGNSTTKGTISRLVSIPDAAQAQRVEGGTQLIPTRLADKIGRSHISLNTAVKKIARTPRGYIIRTTSITVRARKVVVAISPPLINDIAFTPALPHARAQLNKRLRLGAMGKAIAIYKTPFWRKAGNHSGQVFSDYGGTKLTFDNSPSKPRYGALLGFIAGDAMRDLDMLSEDEVKANVTQDFVRYFGERAGRPEEVVIQRWGLEEYSRGGPVAIAPANTLVRFGRALRETVDGIHWAGTETAEYWTGYMDGAIRSGERVAREILG
ncbi:amine oxidase [Lojkania enalia]|uniref:Amine oxidase n=1 Tax=Lojkania enalia TaxID=147567 RepID=A0A9P4K8Q5_9PLEO|nr:amine oxidase [Didymosphaeria enalia]